MTRLDRIVEVRAGGGAPQDQAAFADGGHPFVRAGSLVRLIAGHDERELEKLEPNIASSHGLRLFPSGTVLFAKSGMSAAKGHVYRLQSCAYVVNHLAALVPSAGVDSRYLAHALTEFSPTRLIKDAAYPSIRLSDIAEMKIPLAPLAEQHRIADVLDGIDELRAKQRRTIARYDDLMKAVFYDMFGDPAVNPHRWMRAAIGDVCDLIIDCVNRTAPLAGHPTAFKMVRTTNVKGGVVDLSDVRFVTAETFHRWNRRATPQRGDLLLTREAPVGEVGILDTDDAVFLGQRLMLYRPNTAKVTAEFLRFLFQSRFVQRQFEQHGSGSTVKHLALPVCRSLAVLQPPIELQREFSMRVTHILKLARLARTSLTKLDGLFASTKHRAFRGEL